MIVPAICNNCDTFFPSGIVADNSTNVSISNCTAGPCPKCGGLGHIPDGVYNFIGDSIELLSGPQRSLNELKKLAYILETAKKRETNPQALKNEIKRSVPELSSISDLLPKTRSEFYNFIINRLCCWVVVNYLALENSFRNYCW